MNKQFSNISIHLTNLLDTNNKKKKEVYTSLLKI